jgi:preprotein translocase subunit SecF
VASLLVLGSWVLGATTLEEFGIALLIGLFAGAYSSVFIASPMLAWLKEREPKYKSIKEKVASKQPGDKDLVGASVGATATASATKAASGAWGSGRAAKAALGAPVPEAAPASEPDTPTADRPTPTVPVRPAGGNGSPIPPRPRKKGKKR